MSDCRMLDYRSNSEVMPDVDRLLEGHRTVGKWSLGQICDHLVKTIDATMTPIRRPPQPATPEQLAGKARVFETRVLPDNMPQPIPGIDPDPEVDDRAGVDRLRAAMDRLEAHPGEFQPHPLLGPLTPDEWRELHLIHNAHHLRFAVPA